MIVSMVAAPLKNRADCLNRQLRRAGGWVAAGGGAGEGVSRAGDAMAAVNLRCIDGMTLDTIPVTHFDGRSL